MSLNRSVSLLAAVLVLGGCAARDHQDLVEYMQTTKEKPSGHIEPLPPFVPYQNFTYSAMTMRSPFDPPVEQVEDMVVSRASDVKPDTNREREFLEGFNLTGLRMVGTLARGGITWALIDDGQGGIHRVTDGNYLGKNHGRIVATSPFQIEIIEIVPNGSQGWVERPQVLQLAEKE